MKKNFPQKDVLALYDLLEKMNIKVWLDGGWGVDALLGRETRQHRDLDIVIQQKDLTIFRKLLQEHDYINYLRDDNSEWNFVLVNEVGLKIDVDVITLDKQGNGIYGPVIRNSFYPVDALLGIGQIGEIIVRCLTAEYQVQSHQGYHLEEKDFLDVIALCKKFSISFPDEYKN